MTGHSSVRMYAFDVSASRLATLGIRLPAARPRLLADQPEQRSQLVDAGPRLVGAAEEDLLEDQPIEGREDHPREHALAVEPERAQLALDQRDVLVVDGAQLGQHLRPAVRLEAHLVLVDVLVL